MTTYKILLSNDTVGTIDDSTIDFQPIENFIGETVTVHLHDENGNPIEVEGKLVDVLDRN